MIFRIITKIRGKLLFYFILVTFIIFSMYVYLSNVSKNLKDVQWTGERCMSELKSTKYQLDVVTEYKNRIDKLLIETRKERESDKEKFKEIMESCVAMKQQSLICQGQFDDLEMECTKVRQNYDSLLKELEKLKTSR